MNFQFGHDFNTASATEGSKWYPPHGFDALCKYDGFDEKNGFKGLALIWRFEVLEGEHAGKKFAHVFKPGSLKPDSKHFVFAELKRCVGAIYGLDAQGASAVNDQAIKGTCAPGAFVGRVVRVRATAFESNGKTVTKNDYLPHLVNGQPVDVPHTAAAAPVPAPAAAPAYTPPAAAFAPPAPPVAAPVPPPAPAPIDHKTRALAAGWQPHPTAPGYFYLGQLVKTEAEIVAGQF